MIIKYYTRKVRMPQERNPSLRSKGYPNQCPNYLRIQNLEGPQALSQVYGIKAPSWRGTLGNSRPKELKPLKQKRRKVDIHVTEVRRYHFITLKGIMMLEIRYKEREGEEPSHMTSASEASGAYGEKAHRSQRSGPPLDEALGHS